MASPSTPDLCVIGAGGAGLATAIEARRLGASVVVVDKGAPGGTSLRAGALAAQALAVAAEIAAAPARGAAFGIFAEPPRVSFRKVHDHVAEIVAQRAPDSAAVRLAAIGLDLVTGVARFADARTVAVGEQSIRPRRVVVATGARPVIPAIPGLDSVPFFTTETIFDNTRKLSHLVVIGAGPLGLELALSHRRLGCDVTVVEAGRALGHADPELAEIALRRLREEGVTLLEDSGVLAVQPRSQGIGVTVAGSHGQQLALDASHILVAAARVANLDELDLEAGRIRRAKADPGALALSPALRTSNPRVYAVGEAAGHAPAPHLGWLEAEMVVRAALLGRPTHYEPAAVPRLTLTDPPIAEVGLSEGMARARFRSEFRVLRASYADADKARAERGGMGLVKLIVARSGRILGAGIVGPAAGELAALFDLAIGQRLEARQLAEIAAPYPSYAELAHQLGAEAASGVGPSRWQSRLLRLNRLLP